MTIYVCFYMVTFISSIIEKSREKILSGYGFKITAFSGFVYLWLLFSLRHESMGTDLGYLSSYGYLAGFETISSMDLKDLLAWKAYLNYEVGFVFLNKIVGSVWCNRQFYLCIMALIQLFPIYLVIKDKSKDAFLSYAILTGLQSFLILFSGMRQAIAIGICFYLLKYIENKQFIKFLIGVFIASLFHFSAIVYIVSYFIYRIQISDKIRDVSLLLVLFTFAFKEKIFLLFAPLLKDNVSIVDTGAGNLALIYIIIYIFIYKFFPSKEEVYCGYLNLFFIACLVQIFGSVSNIAGRIGFYFSPVLCLLIPYIIEKQKFAYNKLIMKAIVAFVFIIYALYSIEVATWACSYPYYFFWEM